MVIRRWVIGVFIGILFAVSALSQQYTINTIAGTAGTTGFAGDGGSALSAQLNFPTGIAIDKSGNLYISDGLNNRVRKISGGVISTVAGNGTAGYTGDKGQATSAELNNPSGLALDPSGNLYIADTGNNVIRMVNTSGIITTFAGNNTAGYSGDMALATGAQLTNPVGVTADTAGNVYIADTGNNVIRQVYSGNIVTYAEGFTQPDAVAVDSSGNIYVADTQARRIVQYTNAGVYTTIAGNGYGEFSGDNGPGPSAALYDPMGLAVDSSGNVYIADTFNCRIRKVTPSGIITTIAGNGSLYFSGDGGPATQAALHFPHGVAVDSSGNVFITDTVNSVVRELQGTLPTVTANGVVNAASFAPTISPGALATVFGSNFAVANAGAQAPLPSSVEGVSVKVNGQLAPILYVTSTQVNFQVPWETALGPATVTVVVNGGASNSATVNVLGAAPGLFSSSGQAIVQNSNYTLNEPTNPAKAGSTIIAYLSGSGMVNPPVADGAIAPLGTLVYANSPSGATIGPETAQVAFAGLAPGFVGLVQVNIVVPSDLPTGNYPLTVTIGNETSNSATISVSQ